MHADLQCRYWPMGNRPAAASISLLALAFLQRDGILLAVGLLAAAISAAIFVAGVTGAFLLANGGLAGGS